MREPEQFEMAYWFDGRPCSNGNPRPNCGTAACIAGWALSIDFKQNPLQTAREFKPTFKVVETPSYPFWKLYESETIVSTGHGYIIASRAEEVLSLSQDEGDRLFVVSNWPMSFRNQMDDARDALQKASVAYHRINHFIKTNGAE